MHARAFKLICAKPQEWLWFTCSRYEINTRGFERMPLSDCSQKVPARAAVCLFVPSHSTPLFCRTPLTLSFFSPLERGESVPESRINVRAGEAKQCRARSRSLSKDRYLSMRAHAAAKRYRDFIIVRAGTNFCAAAAALSSVHAISCSLCRNPRLYAGRIQTFSRAREIWMLGSFTSGCQELMARAAPYSKIKYWYCIVLPQYSRQ